MTKTLSEQLCEIVGLSYSKTVGEMCEILPNKSRRIFLDFEQPENFVKLIELPLKNAVAKTLGNYLWWQDFEFITRISILVYLIRKLGIDTEINKQIKQSIRDYDGWVWG